MFDLLKDLIKIFVESIVEFWVDVTLTKGTRDFIEGENSVSKKKAPAVCFFIAIICLIAISVWGILSFKNQNYIEGTVAGIFVIGEIIFLGVLKIEADDKKHR